MRKLKLLSLLLLLIFFFAGQASALLISGQDIIGAPASVADDNPGAENSAQQAFNEKQNVLLTSDLDVDGPTDIAANTWVSSHMIFLNTPDSAFTSDENVTWGFDGMIIGVMSDRWGTLETASNSILGLDNTFYPGSFDARGFEGNDNYSISGSEITVSMFVREPGDWIRVVTESSPAPVPEPATLFLLGTGLLGMAGIGKKRFKKK